MKEIFKSEKSLKIALKRHDSRAYEYIYKLYYRELYYFAKSYMVSSSEADDIIHDTFVTLLEKSHTISENSDLKGYIYLTVKNLCLNNLKHYSVVTRNEDRAANEWSFRMQEYDNDKDELVSRVDELIRKLPEQQQAVIKLKSLGKNYEEIAAELNISKLTVNVHVKRAYQFIRENILLFITIFLKTAYLIFK